MSKFFRTNHLSGQSLVSGQSILSGNIYIYIYIYLFYIKYIRFIHILINITYVSGKNGLPGKNGPSGKHGLSGKDLQAAIASVRHAKQAGTQICKLVCSTEFAGRIPRRGFLATQTIRGHG